MKKGFLVSLMGFILMLCIAGMANATIIFSDNFDSENGGVGALNYNSFANWSVSSGTVDLIGNGFYDLQPGHGLYVDLDGSTLNAGIMISNVINIPEAGAYTLNFDLAGNLRTSNAETIQTSILFGGYSEILTISSLQPFTTYSRTFNIIDPGDTAIQLLFSNSGGDNVGALLDNVSVAGPNVAPVPEPGTILLLGSGLAGLGFWGRRRKKA